MKVLVDHEILFCAFRYALGRATYISSVVADSLIEHGGVLSDGFKNSVCKEIQQAFADGSAGWDCDMQSWNRVRVAFGQPVIPIPPRETPSKF